MEFWNPSTTLFLRETFVRFVDYLLKSMPNIKLGLYLTGTGNLKSGSLFHFKIEENFLKVSDDEYM